MAASHQISADITPSLASIRSSINKIKSAMSKVTIPVNLSVTKKTVAAAHKQIQSYFATQTVQINIAVSRSSLASARKQLQASLSAVSIPQISLKAGVSRQIGALVNSLTRLQTAGPTRTAAGGGGGGGGRSGGGGGRYGGSYGRNSSGGLNLPLGHLSGEASEFSKSMDAATARVFAFGATAIVLNSVAQSFSALVTSTIEVEKKLKEIQAIFNESDESFARFRDTIFDVAANTGQTFETVADGAAELARQGLSAAETAERLNASLVLTRVSGLDAETSVGTLTAVLNGFTSAGLTASQVVNKIFAVDASFAVSAKDLSEAFIRAGSTAEDAGVSIDQFNGLVAALQQRTSRGGAVIGNGLKTIFTRISRGSIIEDLKELGVQIDESQNGIQKLQAIGAAFEDASGDPVRQSAIKEKAAGGFQINLISAALKDLNAEQSLFTSATKASQNASTEAFDRNREQNETLSAQLNGLVASLTNLSEKIGQVTFAPLLSGFVDNAKGISNALSNSLNPDAGFTLAKSFFDGFGSFIKGPLAVVFVAGFLKLFGTVSGFAKQGLQDVLKLNSGNKEALAIQNAITVSLEKNAVVQGLIANQTLTTKVRANLIFNEVSRIAIQEQLRLETLKRVTAELQKQGGFLRKDGSIGFDRNRGDRFRRKAGEIAQSPGFAIAASIGVGAGIGSLKNNDSNQVKSVALGRQIDLLKEKIAALNPEIDGLKIENLNKSIERLTREQNQASEGSEKYQESVDRVGTAAAATVGLWSITGKNIVGVYGLLATAALALREVFLKKFEELNQSREDARAASLGDGISTTSEEDFSKRFQAAQDRLAQGFDLLNKSVLRSAQSFNSELKTRSEAQTLSSELGSDYFDFIKSINEQRPDSKSKRIAERDVEKRGAILETTNLLNKLSKSGNASLDARANEAGFSSISKIPSGDLRSLTSSIIKGFSQDPLFNGKTSGLITGQLSPEARKTFLRPESASDDEIKNLGEELSGLKNLPDDVASKLAKELGDTIKNTATGQDILRDQSVLVNLISQLKTIDPETGSISSIISQFEKLIASGIADEDAAKEILKAINSEKAPDRKFQVEELQERVKLIKEGEKAAIDALNKAKTDRLDALNKERELNESFLERLENIYGDNIDRINSLSEGGKISQGLNSSDFNDFASKNLKEVLEKLGIEGIEQKGITGEKSSQSFASNLFKESTRDFFDVFSALDKSGQKLTLSETDQKTVSDRQKNIDAKSGILGGASSQSEVLALNPFIEASNLLKNVKSSEDLAKAEALYRQGEAGLGTFSRTDEEDASLRGGLIELARQIVIAGTSFASRGINQENAASSLKDFYEKQASDIESTFSKASTATSSSANLAAEEAARIAAGGKDINRQTAFGVNTAAAQKAQVGTIDTRNAPPFRQEIGEAMPEVVKALNDLRETLISTQKEGIIGDTSGKTEAELARQQATQEAFSRNIGLEVAKALVGKNPVTDLPEIIKSLSGIVEKSKTDTFVILDEIKRIISTLNTGPK